VRIVRYSAEQQAYAEMSCAVPHEECRLGAHLQ